MAQATGPSQHELRATAGATEMADHGLHRPFQEPVEILGWVALLWILPLAKARSAASISAVISAKRATQANAKINATVDGARQKGSWRRRSVVTAR